MWERGETVQLFAEDLDAVLDRGRPRAFWWDGRLGRYVELTTRQREAILREMDRLEALARAGRLELDCFCKQPKRHIACHGDAIRAALLRRIGGLRCDDCGPIQPWEGKGTCSLCQRMLCGACAACHMQGDCPSIDVGSGEQACLDLPF